MSNVPRELRGDVLRGSGQKMSKLKTLRLLRESLSTIAQQRRDALARGDDPDCANLQAACDTLVQMVQFCEFTEMEGEETWEWLFKTARSFETLRLLRVAIAAREAQCREAVEAIAAREAKCDKALAEGCPETEFEALMKGPATGDAELEAAGCELVHVLAFLEANDGDAMALHKLNAALLDRKMHGRLAAMLQRPPRGKKTTDGVAVQHAKGVIAAAVAVLMKGGYGQERAMEWVARKTPDAVAKKLSPSKGVPLKTSAVKDFYHRFNRKNGKPEDHYGRKQCSELIVMVERRLAMTPHISMEKALEHVLKSNGDLLPQSGLPAS